MAVVIRPGFRFRNTAKKPSFIELSKNKSKKIQGKKKKIHCSVTKYFKHIYKQIYLHFA